MARDEPASGGSPISFPEALPISARVRDIAVALHEHQVIVVAGATGSGKTTQLPKIALAMGRGVDALIGVTQPRRLAATSVAARVAEELGSPLGADVGYKIRFDDRTSKGTYVKFMTDGVLLAEIEHDRLLRRYDTLIIDEAHERSLTIDFVLGWLRRILPERPELKVVVSSATLETGRFSAFFGGAPVIEVEGRTFPVDVLYEPPPDDVDQATAVADAVARITALDPRGDVLVFLPGEREIREAEQALLGRALRHTRVVPLFARLTAAEQARAFADAPERKIILATNVAETSITLPRIVYVVDTGVVRLSRYDARSGTTRLQIEGVSQASAEQRKGRCGRVRDGVCVRLYDEPSFAARPGFTDPEIKRTGLAGVILRMKALSLGDVEEFAFLDPPGARAVAEGYRVLEELGALDERRELTDLGRRLARFPVDPRLARMILEGSRRGCLREVLTVTAFLSVQDPRERPAAALQRADQAHARFRDPASDFVGALRLWAFVEEAERRGSSHLRRVCKESFLSFLRVREWIEVRRQLADTARELGLEREPTITSDADPLHASLASGLLSRVGMWNQENKVYIGAKQTRFTLHPSSALAKKPPGWVMAFELVETTRLFARMAARVEPEWLCEVGGHLLRRSYSSPHWSARSARASVREHATLFGLPVRKDRSVDYAPIAPAQARRIFLTHALVRGELETRGAFHDANRALYDEVARLRDKARRSDMLADEGAVFEVFDRVVPADVACGKDFEAWRERAERVDPRCLFLSREELLAGEGELRPEDYPDAVTLHGAEVGVTYRFDPSADDDGITLTVPLSLLPQLSPGELEWMIPGEHARLVASLLDELPRARARELGDLGALARAITPRLTPFRGELVPETARAIEAETGVSLPDGSLRPDALPPYLRPTVHVVDAEGRTVARGRDVAGLLLAHGARAREAWQRAARPEQERRVMTTWDLDELPEHVDRRVGATTVRAYPALFDRGTSVELELAESRAAADAATRAGVRRLLSIATKRELSACVPKALPQASRRTPSRAEAEAEQARVRARVVEEAFGLDHAPLPRTREGFESLLRDGRPGVAVASRRWSTALAEIATELGALLAALQAARGQPVGKAAIAELAAHVERLVPADFIDTIPAGQLAHVPRYLRAARARLARALHDPRKDAEKLAQLAPHWDAFTQRRASARDLSAVEELRWALEELRVSIFAPELRTPVQVSTARVAAMLAALR
ncbi:MAG: ATP-dependent RNA helicase HrpA [Polyangiaceae bacterium]|nr:ATP-dependent RNA helicase HrpA [Polyangiaceae bacterium]